MNIGAKIALTVLAIAGPALAACITGTVCNRLAKTEDSETLKFVGGLSIIGTWVSAVSFTVAQIWGL